MARKLLLLAAGLALLAGCSTAVDGAAVGGPATKPATSAAGTTTPGTTPETTTARATGAAPRPCDPAVIAEDLGRPQSQVLLGQCRGDWALMDNGGQYGDTDYLVREVGGRWMSYAEFPTRLCRGDAANDGVPAEWQVNFPECAPSPAPASVDLGLSTPISSPACDGSGIVILRSAVDPANYARDVQQGLDAHPGARYLRTDRSCPSLNPVDAAGNPIYAVYLAAGRERADICRELGRAPADAYAKVLDTTTPPSQSAINC